MAWEIGLLMAHFCGSENTNTTTTQNKKYTVIRGDNTYIHSLHCTYSSRHCAWHIANAQQIIKWRSKMPLVGMAKKAGLGYIF